MTTAFLLWLEELHFCQGVSLKDVRVTYSVLTSLGKKKEKKPEKNPTKDKKEREKKERRRRPWSYLQAGKRLAIQHISKQLSCGSSLEAQECGVRQELSHGVFPGGCPASRRAGPRNRSRRPVENHPLVKPASCCSTNGKNRTGGRVCSLQTKIHPASRRICF